MRLFHLFLSCQLMPSIHRWVHRMSLAAAMGWFYFAFVHLDFWQRFAQARLMLIDLLVGLPLAVALGAVIYGLAYWLAKWGVILFRPSALTCPDEEEGEQ